MTTLLSYAGAASFAALLVLIGVAPMFRPAGAVAVLAHVLLYPVVAGLRAPEWARMGGYAWLSIDIVSSVMAMNGVDAGTITAVRLGGHIPAALWIVAASLEARGPMRVVGVPLGALLFGYSLVAPWVPPVALLPAIILIVVWLALVGRVVGRSQAAIPPSVHA